MFGMCGVMFDAPNVCDVEEGINSVLNRVGGLGYVGMEYDGGSIDVQNDPRSFRFNAYDNDYLSYNDNNVNYNDNNVNYNYGHNNFHGDHYPKHYTTKNPNRNNNYNHNNQNNHNNYNNDHNNNCSHINKYNNHNNNSNHVTHFLNAHNVGQRDNYHVNDQYAINMTNQQHINNNIYTNNISNNNYHNNNNYNYNNTNFQYHNNTQSYYHIEDNVAPQCHNWIKHECHERSNTNNNHSHVNHPPKVSEQPGALWVSINDAYVPSHKRTSGEIKEPAKGELLRQRRRRLWNGID